jgi:uncharacterized protein (DUF697 family)
MARKTSGASAKGKGSGFSVARLLDVVSSGQESFANMDAALCVRVHVDPDAPAAHVNATRHALVATRPGAEVQVRGMELRADDKDVADLAIVLAGSNDYALAALVVGYALRGVPVGVVVESALDVPKLPLTQEEMSLVGIVAASEASVLPAKLAAWMVSCCDKDIALSAAFPFCRDAETSSLVSRCALENAAIGAIALIPGSDFPLMTVNQAKLALDIAAAHGLGISPERALELAGVVGAGLVYRAIARGVVGLVPGFGWAFKAGMGYGGTVATGQAVKAWLERGEKPVRPTASAPDITRVIALPRATSPAGETHEASFVCDPGYLVIEDGAPEGGH